MGVDVGVGENYGIIERSWRGSVYLFLLLYYYCYCLARNPSRVCWVLSFYFPLFSKFVYRSVSAWGHQWANLEPWSCRVVKGRLLTSGLPRRKYRRLSSRALGVRVSFCVLSFVAMCHVGLFRFVSICIDVFRVRYVCIVHTKNSTGS